MEINKNALIGGLLAIIFVMAIGYAAFATQLRIGGLATAISSSKWDIHIKSISAGTPVGGAYINTTPSIGPDRLSATFSTVLVAPNDSLSYTVVVENSGNLDAKLSDIIFNAGDSTVINYSYKGINKGDILKTNETISFTINVSYNDVSIPPTGNDLTSNMHLFLSYVQA